MKSNFTDILKSMDEEELSSLMDGVELKTARSNTSAIKRSFYAKMGLKKNGSSEVRPRFSLKYLAAAALSLIVLFALGFGTYAYAAEAREYRSASEFFEQNHLSSEGMTRKQIVNVYNDISTGEMNSPDTKIMLTNNLGINVIDTENYARFSNSALWSVVNMSNMLYPDEELMNELELFIWPTIAINYYQGAGAFVCTINDCEAKIQCDNAGVGRVQLDQGNRSLTTDEISRLFPIFVYGDENISDGSYKLEKDNAAVRIIFSKDGRLYGYALICYWGTIGNDSLPCFENAKIIKAVKFEEDSDVTYEEVNRRLDEAYSSIVIDGSLYDTKNDIGAGWNDWYERNSEWYWNYYKNR